MSYAKRVLQVTFSVNGQQPVTVSGLRTYVHIENANSPSPGSMTMAISGLTLSHINNWTRAGTTFQTPGNNTNTVTIAAGDEGGQLTTVFQGIVMWAQPEFDHQPSVTFVVAANATYDLQLNNVQPVSMNGAVTIQQFLTQIFKPAGITVQNNGVNVTLQNPYAPGDMWHQALRACRAARCMSYYDSINRRFIIWPITNPQVPGAPILISPATGMINYPKFQQSNIIVRTIFSGNIFTMPSQLIRVQSQLSSANGLWVAAGVNYELATEDPSGPWEVVITGYPQNLK